MNLQGLTTHYSLAEIFTSQIPHSQEAISAIEEEKANLEKAVSFWMDRAKYLPEKDAALFTQQIKVLAEETLNFILTLSSNLSHCTNDIHLEAKFSLEKLNASAHTFYQNCQLHQRKKDEINLNLDRMDAKIQSTSVPFDDFVIPSNSSCSNNQDLFQRVLNQEEKAQKIEQMLTARSLVITGNILSTPINIAAQLGTEAVKKICGSHPTLETGCQNTSEVFSNLMDTVSRHIPSEIKETMSQMAENRKQNHAKEVIYNEQVLGIPASMTEQYLDDLPGAALTLGTMTIGFRKAGKSVSPLLKTETEELLANTVVKEAKKRSWKSYAANLPNEKKCVEQLVLQYPSFNHPEGIPKHLNLFFSACETHQFKTSGLGQNKNGILEGHLIYARTKENILFVIQNHSMYVSLTKKIGGDQIFKSKNLNSEERMKSIIDVVMHFAKENRYKKVLLAWDSTALSLASQLSKRSEAILSTGSFSAGINARPLTLIEISL